jgi:hypothetical protein
MTIPTSTTSAVCRLLRGILCSVLALFAAGCVSWMDSETIEKDVPETWEAVQLSDGAGAERTIESLAIYKIGRGSKLRAGLRHLVEPGSTDVAGEEIVLGPGDLVHGSAATSKIERRTDVELEPAGAVGPVVVSPAFSEGRCEAVAHQLVFLAERRMIEQFSRVPNGYRIDGEFFSPDEVDSSQLLLWLFTPPVELGRLLTRALGGRFVEPTSYREELVGSYSVPVEEAEKRQYFRPVAGRGCLWELALAGADGEVLLEGEVTTAASGRSVIPIWEHAQVVRDNIDFGTVARLTVRSGSSGEPRELTVNLLELSFEAPK